jgi:hypothetical protein
VTPGGVARAVSIALAATGFASHARALEVETNFAAFGNISGFYQIAPRCGIAFGDGDANDAALIHGVGGVHLGGASDAEVDPGETVRIDFISERRGVRYRLSSAGDGNLNGTFGDSVLQAFDLVGGSLGVEVVSGLGPIDAAALFAGQPIRTLQITAIDSLRIRSGSYRVQPGQNVEAPLNSFSDFTASLWRQCGMLFSSEQGDLSVDDTYGVGVVGGASGRVEGGETLVVEFDEPLGGVTYRVADGTDVGGTSDLGEHFVEAFDATGASLGLLAWSESDGTLDLSAAHGGALLSRFELIALNDAFRLHRVAFVPEPGGAIAAGAACVGMLAAFRRRTRGAQARASSDGRPSV